MGFEQQKKNKGREIQHCRCSLCGVMVAKLWINVSDLVLLVECFDDALVI